MSARICLLGAALGMMLSSHANATVFRTSQIVSYTTGNLGASGTGDLDGWQNATAQVTVTNGSGSLDGTSLGLVASAGDKVEISATASLSARNQFVPNSTGPGRFWIASGANANFDEFRVASTWAEAAPPAGQCIAAGINSDPTNQTVVAGISATLRITASGTSPAFQWQISTNGGGTWSILNGATAATYTTPNLTLADNGNQYRAMASVQCNGSSATSAVATLTVNAPVITPPGLVVDDAFDDQLRDNVPVSIDNSVWRTANSPGLDAISGDMIGTPSAGSSSLWLGYFTEDSNLPVTLDVGRAIRVTLVFTPNGNVVTDNAGSPLRFGLYDYADGGLRLANDGSAAGGSTGNGAGVRGYMLTLAFGTTLFDSTPLEIFARSFLDDINLMGTTGDYVSLGSGPIGLTSQQYWNPALQLLTPTHQFRAACRSDITGSRSLGNLRQRASEVATKISTKVRTTSANTV